MEAKLVSIGLEAKDIPKNAKTAKQLSTIIDLVRNL